MKKGISLVALVITIIVLIILTGAVILSFQDGGIIDRADQAVKDSNDAVLEEKITMMNLEYTQKLKKKFTPETRELLKAIVKQSGIDLDKLLVYYDGADGEQHVFYKIDKVTKEEVEWFLEHEVTVGEENKKIYLLFGDVDLDGELTYKDADKIQAYSNYRYEEVPELPIDNRDYCYMIADITSDGSIESDDADDLRLAYTTKIIDTKILAYLSVKEGYIKTYFGIE